VQKVVAFYRVYDMKELNTFLKSIFAQWKCHYALERHGKGALQKLPYIELQFKKQM